MPHETHEHDPAPRTAALTERMFGALRESVVVTDADLDGGPRIVYANAAFWTMTGYEPGELLGKTPRVLQGPATDRKLLARLRQDLRAGRPFEGKAVNYRKDGTEYHVDWYIEPVFSSDGEVECYVGVQRDVTEDVEQQAALHSVLSALSASPEGLLFLNAQGLLTRVNPAALELLKIEASASMLGRSLTELLESRGAVSKNDGRWLLCVSEESTPMPRTVELLRIGQDGGDTFWRVTDTTEQRRVDALANAVNLVEQTGYVFAGIRHELGNPVNNVKTALTVLAKHGEGFSADKRQDYYTRMLDEVTRIDYLLRALRNYNAHESTDIRRFNLNEHVQDFLRVADAGVPDGTEVLWSPADEPLHVLGDGRGLFQVLLNLVKNAADAVCGATVPTIALAARRVRGVAVLTVADNGAGMSPQQLESIGRPFCTTKAQGTGLGVCVSQRILASMNGVLEYESRLGEGTTVRVQLPLEVQR